MMNKRKKVTKYRGSKTHGCGSMKKRRGAGHRGGRGNAGSGKRADTKKPSLWKNPVGKHGFVTRRKKLKIVNIQYIENSCAALLSEKNATLKDGVILIDLTKLGFDKLLSKGNTTRKYELHIETATNSALERIKAAGGTVILPQKEEKIK